MFEVVRGTDDLPDFLHGKDLRKFSGCPPDAESDGDLFFCDVFVEETKPAENSVATIGSLALFTL
jgi:hypothetical protein